MEKKKVIIIGCGRVAAKHIKAICKLKNDLELRALVDVSEDAPKKLIEGSKLSAEAKEKVQVFKDYKEAIDTIKPDIVAVTVPSGLHYQIAEYGLSNGCNLLLEKPMTMSSEESRLIYELSQKTGNKIAMGHIYRYFPLVKYLREDIVSGKFGKITHGTIYVRWGHGEDYYQSAAWRGTWRSDGGAMMNQTIHAIDLLVWLMGTKAVSATAMLSQRLRNIEAEDIGMAVLKMDDGSLASIEGTTATSDKEHEAMFSIFAEDGTISLGIRNGKPKLNIRYKGKSRNMHYIMQQIKADGIGSMLNALNPHTGIYDDFVKALKEGRQPLADALSGYSSVDTLMGIYRSAKEKREIPLPLQEPFASSDMTGFFR
ncbi:MAG: Gfo/Idh/MocA family oxidoreductase [Clostridiales bacterium]|nr:Gfo/Idh/MocA family oxidoreductase [Clostridiales bacterium]